MQAIVTQQAPSVGTPTVITTNPHLAAATTPLAVVVVASSVALPTPLGALVAEEASVPIPTQDLARAMLVAVDFLATQVIPTTPQAQVLEPPATRAADCLVEVAQVHPALVVVATTRLAEEVLDLILAQQDRIRGLVK